MATNEATSESIKQLCHGFRERTVSAIAVFEYHSYNDRHLEILGFAEEHVVEYAESVFSESDTLCSAFLQYINGNPIIKGMMYLPLNAVIVAMIFKDSYGTDCPFPKTMTQLFDALTRSLIRRHLVHNRMITDDYCMPQPLQRIEDITKLGQLKVHPEISVADQFVKLAKMAYNSLLNETYVFSHENDFDHLGLMKKNKALTQQLVLIIHSVSFTSLFKNICQLSTYLCSTVPLRCHPH